MLGIGVGRLYMYAGYMRKKYGIGLKLQACIATVLTVETGKRMTGLLVSAPPIPIPTNTGEYWPIPDTGIGRTLIRNSGDHYHEMHTSYTTDHFKISKNKPTHETLL